MTEEQTKSLNLPTRPTKRSDPRSRGFSGESIEVDAIPVEQLRELKKWGRPDLNRKVKNCHISKIGTSEES